MNDGATLARVSLYPSPPPSTLARIPSGDAGTLRTLDEMVKLVRRWKKDAGIWKLSRQIVQPVPAHDYRGEVDAIFHWVKRNIRYTQDVRDVETLATPKATLEARAGDCDDMATLLATLLESVGHPARFIAVSFPGEAFSHVIAETRIGPSWVALDTTVAKATVGWRPPGIDRTMIRHI